MRKAFLLLFSFFAFAGCTTFSKTQCENMNWYQRGFEAATRGETSRETGRYYGLHCAKEHKVSVNEDGLAKGYEAGLKTFCTAENLRKFSSEGGVYRETCPENLMTPQVRNHLQSGRDQFLLKKISDLEQEVKRLRSVDDEVQQLREKVGEQEDEIAELKRRN